MANTEDYSQFIDFDPDNLPASESNSIESLSQSSTRNINEDEITSIWDRKKLAELVNFEEDTELSPAKKSDSPEANLREPDNIISRHELFESNSDSDEPNHSKTERTFSNSPWTKGGLIGIGAMVVFVSAGLFLNNVFNRGKVTQTSATPTPTPTFTPAPTPTENETGKLKTEIALGTQAEQLAALNRAKSPSNSTATRNPSLTSTATNTSPNQTPTRSAYPVYRPPANNQTSSPPRVIVREVVKRVPVPIQQPASVRSAPVALVRPRQEIVRSTPPLRSAPSPTLKPTPTATQALPPPDPLAQWQALARVGSYGQADVPENGTQEVAAVPIPGQSAELAMPRPTGIPTAQVTAYSSTGSSPNAPERSSFALPQAVPVIANPPAPYTNQGNGSDLAAEENLLLNGSPSAIAQARPNLEANNSEENLPLNDSRITQSQSNLVATNPGMPAVDAEEDVLLGRVSQQSINSLPVNSPVLSGQYLQVGTSANGKLITPVLNPSDATTANANKYANKPSNPNTQRFAVQLTSPLCNAYEQPLLNSGTLIIFTISNVASNGWVEAIAESVVFPDGREYRLPPGVVSIRGTGGEPLIAKKWDDKGSEILSQDANAFLFGALSNVGRVLNQPRSESYEYNSGFGFGGSRSQINRGTPNVLGAVLEGGFSPVLSSIMQRNAIAIQEIRQRPNIWYVKAGQNVEIFVNQSFQF
ncbi:hypothetical protein NIES2119_19685 [[Phormidium ambiguum] IAM M-71]|uniref:Conjugal transfer protein TrbI n=1 Tax=[Phormidium ambiguum] IAM M-71 TaxID=454136 RepID=A0A1U7IFJ5_9CYAN|nr:TrbI/VirB10 family protein [Phormidium ambiguum]OKH35719.1 hypothetical protein NIES2119_19685 [Phormidium ambiguum IAM M-71]